MASFSDAFNYASEKRQKDISKHGMFVGNYDPGDTEELTIDIQREIMANHTKEKLKIKGEENDSI